MKVEFTEKSLREVGVELLSENPPTLKCMTCEVTWFPKIGKDAKLPDDWWQCTTDLEHNEKFNTGFRDASKKEGRVTSEYLSTLPKDLVRAYRLGFQAGSNP
jgi:hypothetical protein